MSKLNIMHICPNCAYDKFEYNEESGQFTCLKCNESNFVEDLISDPREDNNIEWSDKNPPENIDSKEMLLIRLQTIINTEKGIETTENIFPAMLKFNDDDTATWTIIDGIDSFNITCSKTNTIVNNINYSQDDSDDDSFIKEYRFITAWTHMPSINNPNKKPNESDEKYVIVGYNEETGEHGIIMEHDDPILICEIFKRIAYDTKRRNKSAYPFILNNNLKTDKIELYRKSDIGNPDARIMCAKGDCIVHEY